MISTWSFCTGNTTAIHWYGCFEVTFNHAHRVHLQQRLWTLSHTDVMQLVLEVGIQLLSTRRRVHMVAWGTEAHTGVAIPLGSTRPTIRGATIATANTGIITLYPFERVVQTAVRGGFLGTF